MCAGIPGLAFGWDMEYCTDTGFAYFVFCIMANASLSSDMIVLDDVCTCIWAFSSQPANLIQLVPDLNTPALKQVNPL